MADIQELVKMDDRIDNYLKGNMSSGEELQFMEDCVHNPELKERAAMTALIAKVLGS